FELPAREPFALPARKVGVLQRQRCQRRLASQGKGLVKPRQLAGEDADRPAIGDDVMDGVQKDVLFLSRELTEPQQGEADQRTALEVERQGRLFSDDALRLLPPSRS